MTDEQIKEARELCRTTVSLPWTAYEAGMLLSQARTLLPAALDEIERLRGALEYYADSERWVDWSPRDLVGPGLAQRMLAEPSMPLEKTKKGRSCRMNDQSVRIRAGVMVTDKLPSFYGPIIGVSFLPQESIDRYKYTSLTGCDRLWERGVVL